MKGERRTCTWSKMWEVDRLHEYVEGGDKRHGRTICYMPWYHRPFSLINPAQTLKIVGRGKEAKKECSMLHWPSGYYPLRQHGQYVQ